MRKFLITVNEKQYEVEVEDVKNIKKSESSFPGKLRNNSMAGTKAVSANNSSSANGSSKVNAPMPGSILKVHVSKGDIVKRDQSLLVLEAMKMENDIMSPVDGKIIDIKVAKGESVNLGQLLLEIA